MSVRTFALLHSPVLGPSSWSPMQAELERRGHEVSTPSMLGATTWFEYAERAVMQLPTGDVVLTVHSGAGPLAPVVASNRPGARCVFVDAAIPARAGSTPLAPAEFLGHLRSLARDGVLPPWLEWWPADVVTAMLPDAAARAELATDMPRVPLAYFEASVPVPDDWPEADSVYLRLSGAYDQSALDADERGWPTARIVGHHLSMYTDPERVADAIEALLDA